MTRVRSVAELASFLLLSACATATPGQREARPTSSGAESAPEHSTIATTTGCPPARDVWHARWLLAEEGGPVPIGTGYWAIRLGHWIVEDGAPPPGPITAEALAVHDIAVPPATVWILRPGAEACTATVSSYHGELVEDGLENVMFSAITTDCAGTERDGAWGWVSTSPPGTDCEWHRPTELGRVELALEDDGTTRVPTSPAPVPAAYAGDLPPPVVAYAQVSAEELAGTTPLWAIRVAAGAPDVAEVWVTRVIAEPPNDPCSWLSADYQGLHVGNASHMRRVEWPGPEARPMTLEGVLVDDRGTQVVLFTDAPGMSATFDLAADGPLRGGRVLDEFVGNEEDCTFRSLAPYCGP
jgi:hypothetical protein